MALKQKRTYKPGDKYGKLTLIGKTEKRQKDRTKLWECLCECGKSCFYRAGDVGSGRRVSCGCKGKREYVAGQKYGHLTLIRFVGKDKWRAAIWEMRCDCGHVGPHIAIRVASGDIKTCGIASECEFAYRKGATTSIIGNKYYHLKLVGKSGKRVSGNSGNIALWECLCDCGTTCYKQLQHVLTGNVRSCGCSRWESSAASSLKTRKYDPIISTARAVWRGRYAADGLSFDDFYHLSQLPCDYCGILPSNTSNVATSNKAISPYQKDNGDFTYNGLDRVDSSAGHTLDNVVPCCYPCNWSKLNHTRDEFLAHNERIYLHTTTKQQRYVGYPIVIPSYFFAGALLSVCGVGGW